MCDTTMKLVFENRDGNQIATGSVTAFCIHDVEVSQDYRLQGIGRKLIESLKSLGGSWLWVDQNDKGVIEFYKKCGFILIDDDTNRFAIMSIRKQYYALPYEHVVSNAERRCNNP